MNELEGGRSMVIAARSGDGRCRLELTIDNPDFAFGEVVRGVSEALANYLAAARHEWHHGSSSILLEDLVVQLGGLPALSPGEGCGTRLN